jgi:hypothetical protein
MGATPAATAQLISQALARDLNLPPEQATKLNQVLLADFQKNMSRIEEGRKKTAQAVRYTTLNRKTMRKALEGVLDKKQLARAEELLGPSGIQESVMLLLDRGVPANQVEQALPVLVQYHRQAAGAERGPAKGEAKGKAARPGARAKELRADAVKQLAPIVGEEAAAAWAKGERAPAAPPGPGALPAPPTAPKEGAPGVSEGEGKGPAKKVAPPTGREGKTTSRKPTPKRSTREFDK